MELIRPLKASEKGQISIFFSTTVVVMVTLIAFIINIGIFVKAKINLQNATDAAAYAGASVQARQLTNIAYMNWEMRNVFKEWMFKYYVLGGLNLPDVFGAPSGSFMSYTMQSYDRTSTTAEDLYNFPSVCIDFAETGGVGMCTRYLVPGLPRFESSNVLGMDETTNAFIDTIVAEKSQDCSRRSQLNFFTANTWAYNVQTNDASVSNITAQAPQMASNFMGAFPKAFEIGLRIRALEAEVNFAPVGNICVNAGVGVDCNVQVTDLADSPSKERALKAFSSGYRNLGSNGYRDVPDRDDSFKSSFTLTELPPTLNNTIDVEGSTSTMLIPNTAAGSRAKNKYYLDLKLMTLNYSTFYTAFTSTQGDLNVQGAGTISSEGQCNATKIGLPVPGYPLGFAKNPDFLTYYAVEGKAKFVGLFNPFQGQFIVKAYAAAKPFGGRIGPALFNLSDPRNIRVRNNRLSSAYISALDTATFRGTFGLNPGATYEPGMPVPVNIGSGPSKFWMTDESDAIGGSIDGPEIFYGVPNIAYEYPTGAVSTNQTYLSTGSNIQVIARTGVGSTPQAGLYNRDMFSRLKGKLRNIGATVTTQDINEAILMVKSPTIYDASNYLVPTPESVNLAASTDSWGTISSNPVGTLTDSSTSYNQYELRLYAPMLSPGDPQALFTNISDVMGVLDDYILRQEAAVDKYKSSMNLVAADIFNNNNSGATGQNTGRQAALALSDLTDGQYQAIGVDPTSASDPTMLPSCASIAGKFVYFYTGNSSTVSAVDGNCVTPLPELLRTRWADPNLTNQFYLSEYTIPVGFQNELFTAYRPGPPHDAGPADGIQTNAISNSTDTMIRNSYSTKFIPLKSIGPSTDAMYGGAGRMVIYSEGSPNTVSTEVDRASFKNFLNTAPLSIDINSTRH